LKVVKPELELDLDMMPAFKIRDIVEFIILIASVYHYKEMVCPTNQTRHQDQGNPHGFMLGLLVVFPNNLQLIDTNKI
jgi:hypothetical protein